MPVPVSPPFPITNVQGEMADAACILAPVCFFFVFQPINSNGVQTSFLFFLACWRTNQSPSIFEHYPVVVVLFDIEMFVALTNQAFEAACSSVCARRKRYRYIMRTTTATRIFNQGFKAWSG